MNNRDNTGRLRIVTRGSALALWQTGAVVEGLRRIWPGLEVQIDEVRTRGDIDLSASLIGSLEKGVFTLELEAALRAGEADLAVHSLKDLPTADPDGLGVLAVLPRGPVSDLLIIAPHAFDPEAGPLPLRPGARTGTCAPRREALVRTYAPQAQPAPLRGNVPTRVQRLREGAYDAIVLAEAGITRLGLDLSGLVALRLDEERFLPAPGQGAIAVQARRGDERVAALLAPLHDPATARAVGLERKLLAISEAGCQSPFGALANSQHLCWGRLEGDRWVRRRAPLVALAEPMNPLLLEDTRHLWEDDDARPLYHHL